MRTMINFKLDQYVLITILIWLICNVHTVNAFSTGAGACPRGGSAVDGYHVNDNDGYRIVVEQNLENSNIELLMNHIPIFPDELNMELKTLIEYDLTINVTNSRTSFKGALIRVELLNNGQLDQPLFELIPIDNDTNGSTISAIVCETPSQGITHSSNSDKTSMSGKVTFFAPGTVVIDVTIVIVNDKKQSIYAHDLYYLNVLDEETIPTPVPSTILIDVTLEPTTSEVPTITSSPTFIEKCNVCDTNDQTVAYRNRSISFKGIITSCGEIEDAGLDGFLEPSLCQYAKDVVKQSGCKCLLPREIKELMDSTIIPSVAPTTFSLLPTTTIITTFEPTVSALPTYTSSPTFHDKCYVCNDTDSRVTKPDEIIKTFSGIFRCNEIESAGLDRFLSTTECDFFTQQILDSNCGCGLQPKGNMKASPSPSELYTFEPTISSLPTITSSPTYQDKCYICGNSTKRVTNHNAIISVHEMKVSCIEAETAGLVGLISESECLVLTKHLTNPNTCQCEIVQNTSVLSNSSSDLPSIVPSIAPSINPTVSMIPSIVSFGFPTVSMIPSTVPTIDPTASMKPTITTTFEPTLSAAPTTTSAPTFNLPCHVCGDELYRVTKPNEIIIVAARQLTCGEIEKAGVSGFISPEDCPIFSSRIMNFGNSTCGCSKQQQTIPSIEPTSVISTSVGPSITPVPTFSTTFEPTVSDMPTVTPFPTSSEKCFVCNDKKSRVTKSEADIEVAGFIFKCSEIESAGLKGFVPPNECGTFRSRLQASNFDAVCGCSLILKPSTASAPSSEPSSASDNTTSSALKLTKSGAPTTLPAIEAPSSGPVRTFQPTISGNPTITRYPTYSQKCNVCGASDQVVTLSNKTFTLSGLVFSCGEIEKIALSGIFSPSLCDAFSTIIMETGNKCGCNKVPTTKILPTPTSSPRKKIIFTIPWEPKDVEPTSIPSKAPVASEVMVSSISDSALSSFFLDGPSESSDSAGSILSMALNTSDLSNSSSYDTVLLSSLHETQTSTGSNVQTDRAGTVYNPKPKDTPLRSPYLDSPSVSPSPTPIWTFAPTSSAIPTITSAPTFTEKCHTCGNERSTIQNVNRNILLFGENYLCGEVYDAGKNGFIDQITCQEVTRLVQAQCGCKITAGFI